MATLMLSPARRAGLIRTHKPRSTNVCCDQPLGGRWYDRRDRRHIGPVVAVSAGQAKVRFDNGTVAWIDVKDLRAAEEGE